MNILTVASQKGGAGKSTISSHLAIAALQDGITCAVIDTDPQGSLATWWNQRETDDLLYVHSNVSELESRIQQIKEAGVKLLIIDTPPAATDIIRAVIALSNFVLIPTKPSPLDLWAVEKTVEITEACDKPMSFVVSIAKKNARITADLAVKLGQYGPVAPVVIGDRGEFPISMINGRTVMEIYPGSKSDDEIKTLWSFIKKQLRKVKK